jgi:hypothetical protein
MLVYYPEGTLHPPDDGIFSFDEDAVERLGRLYPEAVWWPYAAHVTWWNESTPTALLTGGSVHESADGHEHARLDALWTTLRNSSPSAPRTLLDGRRSLKDLWNFSAVSSFFERYL